MNRTTKAKCSLFVFAISTVAATFLVSNTPAYARRRNCEAQFLMNGKVVKGWTDLGKVGGFLANKKKKCRERARNYARNNIKYNQVGLTEEQVCKNYGKAGGVTIYVDTKVEGKRNSRDSSVKSLLGVSCVETCTWEVKK